MDKGQLRVFGNGKNKVSFTYVDNYCHGLILGVDSLYKVREMRNSVMMCRCSWQLLDGGYSKKWWVKGEGCLPPSVEFGTVRTDKPRT